MAFKVSAVSISVSPFLRELASIDKFITLAPTFSCQLKLVQVRVEFSKNILIWSALSEPRLFCPAIDLIERNFQQDLKFLLLPRAHGFYPSKCLSLKPI